MVGPHRAAAQLARQQNGQEKYGGGAEVLQGVKGPHQRNAQGAQEGIAHPQGEGEAEKPQPPVLLVPVKEPQGQVGEGRRQRTEAQKAVDHHSGDVHAGDGGGCAHGGGIV